MLVLGSCQRNKRWSFGLYVRERKPEQLLSLKGSVAVWPLCAVVIKSGRQITLIGWSLRCNVHIQWSCIGCTALCYYFLESVRKCAGHWIFTFFSTGFRTNLCVKCVLFIGYTNFATKFGINSLTVASILQTVPDLILPQLVGIWTMGEPSSCSIQLL